MKPNVVQVISASVSSQLTTLPASAKIVRHPRSKKSKEDETPMAPPPSEEMIQRLNAMAKQYPFCVSHRTNSHSRLL